ncbi:MAG: hypothetical protein ABSE56_18055 [Bryobacteraceae bacterium]|jgi:hypothetical protein
MKWTDIEGRLLRAKATFLNLDRDLLAVNANERSMTHKFAEHLQREFPGWNVDCEYNRNGEFPKVLRCRLNERVSPDDEYGHTVFPDIIVHRRRVRKSLLVLEAKTSGNSDERDREKLEAFKTDENYTYSFAALLHFVTRQPFDIEIVPC